MRREDTTTRYPQCGTAAGFRLHQHLRSRPCAPCEQAGAEFEAQAARQKRRDIARRRALARLKTIFHEVYDALIEEELNKLEEADPAKAPEATS